MKRSLLLAWAALVLLLAGCGTDLAPIPPRTTPSPIVVATVQDDWTLLEQTSLHIPTIAAGEPCPISPINQLSDNQNALGDSPLYLVGLGPDGTGRLVRDNSYQNGLYAVGVLLFVPPAYTARMLVRGRELDGPSGVLFSPDPGATFFDEWKLDPKDAWRLDTGWMVWGVVINVSGPGCYGLQIDGMGYNEVIVFQLLPPA